MPCLIQTVRKQPKYRIANDGRIVSYHKKTPKLLHPSINRDGYPTVCLYNMGIRTNYLVHRLVAQHFIPNPNNCTDVDHVDEDKLNYHHTNLEWTTHQQNSERYFSKRSQWAFIKDGSVYKPNNLRAFCREYDLNTATMSDVHAGKRNLTHHKGYRKYNEIHDPNK